MKTPQLRGYGPISRERFNDDANLLNQAQNPPVIPDTEVDFMETARRQDMINRVNAELARMLRPGRVEIPRPMGDQYIPESPLYYRESEVVKPRFA
jgi:hypothetical protein